MGQGSLAVLLQFSIVPGPIESRLTLPLEFSTTLVGESQDEHVFKHAFELLLTPGVPLPEPSPTLAKAITMLDLYQMNEEIWADLDAGHTGPAAAQLRRLTTRFLEAGAPDLARRVGDEAHRLARAGTVSDDARKKMTFGTRSLVGREFERQE